MNILFAAAEVSPFSKVGGLADVAGTLPRALAKLGHDVRVITPNHAPLQQGTPSAGDSSRPFIIVTNGRQEQARLHQTELGDSVPVYLVDSLRYFRRPDVYGAPDDLERYLFFSQVVLEAPKRLGWQPDIIHCNDWHTAPLALGLRNRAWSDPFYAAMASVFTIHNLRYRGPDPLLDFMAQGIYYADVINTVSETYAREILTPEYGEGLEKLLGLRRDDLFGIINGIDAEELDPARDPHIPSHYDAAHLERRAPNKAALQEKAGLDRDPEVPLIGMVSRLAEQKGFDLVVQAIAPLLEQAKAQILILGTGEERYERSLEEIAVRYPARVSVIRRFDEAFAQHIYAGSDMFLMPSRFEPCGLGQLIALRYGSVPVVRRTGGLADTVQDCDPSLGQGTGFVFDRYTVADLLSALARAIAAYQDRSRWQELMKRGMAQDFSWNASARKYQELYFKAIEARGPH